MSKAVNIYSPTKRDAKKDHIEKNPVKERAFTLEYFLCFFSFTMLTYSNVTGTIGIAASLVPWVYIIMKHFFSLQAIIRKSWPLLLFPAWALCSTAWSIEPGWTLRASFELILTVAVGILASTCIRPKTLIAAVLSSFFVIAIMCVIRQDSLAYVPDQPMAGIFGSKNAFSGAISILAISSFAVFMDKKQNSLFRIMSILGILITPLLLYLGRSLDAILSLSFTAIILLSVRFLSRYNHKIRLMVGVFILMLAIVLTLILSFAEFSPAFLLNAMGKDATLTGRTYLWNRASDFIADRPLLGVGFNAFWRIDNLHARELWYNSKVPIGSGFNFHNEYIDTLVGTGFVGFAIIVGYLCIAAKRVTKSILGSMSVEQYFPFMAFVLFMIRTPVETQIFSQFSFPFILFCVIWSYFQPKVTQSNNSRRWANIYSTQNSKS